jgi:uncharacterized membrane protein HdeD (DUF308 family)
MVAMANRSITTLGSNNRASGAWLGVVGVIDVIAGVIALSWPGVTVLVLAVIFGLFVLMAGLISIAVGAGLRRAAGRTIWPPYIFGIAAVIAGIICLVHPGAGVFAIILGCALWFLLTGVAYLAMARASSSLRFWFGFIGVLSLIAFVVLIAEPGVAIVTVSIVAGISFLLRGAGQLALAWRLGRHR